MTEAVRDLLDYIDASPTPYHAVAEGLRRLTAAGYERADETAAWDLSPGRRLAIIRDDGSLIALEIGTGAPEIDGFRIIGAHSDSPNLRIKPQPDRGFPGYRQLGVEPYGGVLLHTWLDRDLSLAGRVVVRTASGPSTRLVDLKKPTLRIPNLAIHLYREIRTEGLRLNEQQHLSPLLGPGPSRETELRSILAAHLSEGETNSDSVSAEDIIAWDLMTCDVQPSAVGGVEDSMIFAPRLDNLASAHAALTALIGCAKRGPAQHTRVVVIYDHEEVGSRSASGAAGSFLLDTLGRVIGATAAPTGSGVTMQVAAQAHARAIANSSLISADMAHAVHPNYADRHEPEHMPVLGGGPVIKTNANLSYASDAQTVSMFSELCRRRGITPQHFVVRSDMPCGSTIGPITAARAGIRTVDVGNPMLAMHSCRETAAAADVEPMIGVMTDYLAGD